MLTQYYLTALTILMHLFYSCTIIFKENLEDEYDARRKDHISHFILRLAYCQSWVHIYILTVIFDVLGYSLVHGKLTCIVLNIGKLRTTSATSGSWVKHCCSRLLETSCLLCNIPKNPTETLCQLKHVLPLWERLFIWDLKLREILLERDFCYFVSPPTPEKNW